MIQKASKLLDVKEDELMSFSTTDSFNNDNLLEGFICRKSDHRYGALVIFKINDEETEQIIWATPKLHYPFDKAGVYQWPNVYQSEYYEKLDGTNILAYWYVHNKYNYVTYKTRLTAVVKDSGFSDFKSMWEEYTKNNTWIRDSIYGNPEWNLSFELFGSRNPITIKYDFPLEVNLLFGIRKIDHIIRPPKDLYLPKDSKIPKSFNLLGALHNTKDDLTDTYNHFRTLSSDKNKDELLTEGMVMYAHVGEPSWRMFKCKPEEIEKIHWTASGVIPKNSLFTTGMNVFESNDNPTINDFLELLKEEYPQELITKNTFRIENVWKEVEARIEFIQMVNAIWKMAIDKGFDIAKDKNETMRFISQYFPKTSMGKVGGIILKQAGLLKSKESRQR